MKSGKKMRLGLVLTAVLLSLFAGWMTWDHFDYPIPGIGAELIDYPFAPPTNTWPESIEPIRQKLRAFRRDLVESKNFRYQKRSLKQLSLDGTRWHFTIGNPVAYAESRDISFFKNGAVKVPGLPILPDLDPAHPTNSERLALFLLVKSGEISFFKNGAVKVTGSSIDPDWDSNQPTTFERLSPFHLLVKSGEKEFQFDLNVRPSGEDHPFDLSLFNHDSGQSIFLYSVDEATEADQKTASE